MPGITLVLTIVGAMSNWTLIMMLQSIQDSPVDDILTRMAKSTSVLWESGATWVLATNLNTPMLETTLVEQSLFEPQEWTLMVVIPWLRTAVGWFVTETKNIDQIGTFLSIYSLL